MKLTNLRLVNWHIFSDHTIKIDGDTVITGDNGNGKSTIIDAFKFILSGGEDRHFNEAANIASARTLETYIRGKLGMDGNKYLRAANDITAHIALEFTNEYDEKQKVLGCVLNLSGSKTSKRFYIVEGMGVDQIPYVNPETKEVADYDVIKEACKNHIEAYSTNTGCKTIRARIGELLQINDPERYFSLLNRGVAFSPLDENVTGFVNDFLLKEDRLDISALKTPITSYRLLHKQLNSQKAKVECLKSFVDKGEIYLENKRYISYLGAINYKKDILRNEEILTKKKDELLKKQSQLETNKLEISKYNAELEDVKHTISSLENSEAYNEIRLKSEQLTTSKNELSEARKTEDAELVRLTTEQDISDELDLGYDFKKYIGSSDVSKLNKELNTFAHVVKDLKEKENHNKFTYEREIEDVDNKINTNIKALENLKKGLNVYEDRITNLMAIIKEELEAKYHEEVKLSLLCEAFEIIDKEWANAIEGYMGSQRFDILVDPKYFDDALEIYHNHKKALSIYNVGVVATNIRKDITTLDNSLYSKIKIDNPLAFTKLKEVLGDVICVENETELTNFDKAVTKDVFIYKDHAVKRVNPKNYEKKYIGAESYRDNIEILEKENEGLTLKRNELNEYLEQATHIIEVLDQSRFKENDSISNIWKKIEIIESRITSLEEMVKSLRENDDFVGIQEQLTKLRSKELDARKLLGSFETKRDDLNKDIGSIETQIKDASEMLEQSKRGYDFEIKRNDYDYRYYEFEEKILNDKTIDPRKLKDNYINDNKDYEKIINRGIKEYYSNFEMNLGSDIEDLPKYIQAYNKLKSYNVVQYEQKCKEAYDAAKRAFDDKFVTAIKEKIANAKKAINSVNDILKLHPFGNDEEIYRFTFAPSKVETMAEYYRVITSGKMYGEKFDLLVESMPDKDQQIIRDLFDKVACDENDSSAMTTLEELLDYRKYMSFDLEIKNKYDQKYRFSEIAKEKSGGETQTPFYVVLAACFEELFKKGAYDCNCTIIYDEAFNNMDETRIATLLDYYKSLKHIQFLIVVPTNRSAYLSNSMDLTIGLVKDHNYVNVLYINKENEQ